MKGGMAAGFSSSAKKYKIQIVNLWKLGEAQMRKFIAICTVIMLFGAGFAMADDWGSLNVDNAMVTLLQQPQPDTNFWVGVANPLPIVQSNISISITATLDVVCPIIQTDATKWGIALQGMYWSIGSGSLTTTNTYVCTTGPLDLDPAYIGEGRGIPIAVFVKDPDLTVMPPGLSQVATVTLTITGDSSIYGTIPVQMIPEPATIALLGIGSLTFIRRKK